MNYYKESDNMNEIDKSYEEVTFDKLYDTVASYITKSNELDTITKAYKYAAKRHEGKKRLSGEDYISHPVNVAYILTDLNVDYVTICAALLHETINHGGSTYEDIKNEFGEEIAGIVECISKINKLTLSDDKEASAINLRKVLVGLSEDVRVLFIKLADRLHNMRTIWALDPEAQKQKANETISVLIPIAHRLGINSIKSELEDLSLRYTKPDVYNDILEKLNDSRETLNEELDEMKQTLATLLSEQGISFYIKARVKSVHSIYEKMAKGKKWNEIYDILALRIIVDKVSDCYLAIGLIHSKFRQIAKRFKDYIAMPKENMYQSLHTSIFGIGGYVYEVQIRTHEMDEIAEKGIASHWSYKEHTAGGVQNVFEQKLELFRNLIEQHGESLADSEISKEISNEALGSMIYCFTPKGDVVELPANATPVDFAYRIHSKVGDTTVGAIVNDVMVPLDHKLQDGDIVSIKTSNSGTPSKEWLNFVKTSQAKNKIKSYFSKQDREEYIKKGTALLEREIRKRKLSISEVLNQDNINKICKDLKLDNLDDIYLSIGSLRFTPTYILNIIYQDKKDVQDILLERVGNRKKQNETDYKSDIIVSGFGDIKVSIAKCCKPIKGDDIVGYITKGDGITIHKSDCKNVSNTERLIDVSWNVNTTSEYYTDLVIRTVSGKNYLLDIISLASTKDIYIDSFNTKEEQIETVYKITVKISSVDKLNGFINALQKLKFVKDVERVNN